MFDRILNIFMSGMAIGTRDIVSKFLNHLRITNTGLYLGACKISMIESFYKNSKRLKTRIYFRKQLLHRYLTHSTKIKVFIKDFFGKCDQIRRKRKLLKYTSVIRKSPLELEWIWHRWYPLSANPTKWSNTLKQFVCLSWIVWVFNHFMELAL